jgi:flagellar motor switch protein FliN/FliY
MPMGVGLQSNIDLLLDVPLQITVELGRTRMLIKDVLELGIGSVVELNKLAGESVEVFVNNKLIAKGEVVVIDENFAVRITSIVNPQDRIQAL